MTRGQVLSTYISLFVNKIKSRPIVSVVVRELGNDGPESVRF